MINKAFFVERLADLRAEFQAASGAPAPAVELLVRSGLTLTVEGELRAEDDYLIVDYKLRGKTHRAVVPYDAIVAVGFAPEAPDHKSRAPMGFSL